MELKNAILEELLVRLRVGVFQTSPQEHGRILHANVTLAQTLGYKSVDELLGQPTDLFYRYQDDQKKFVEALIAQGAVENWPLRLKRADGTRLDVTCSAKAIYNMSGAMELIEGILLDQTEANREHAMSAAMMRLSQKLSRRLTLHEVGRLIAAETRQLFEHDAFTLAIYNKDKPTILTYVYSEDTPLGASKPQEYDAGTLEWPSLNPRPQLINRDPAEMNQVIRFVPYGAEERRSMSLMFAPMKYQDELVGVLSVQSYTPGKYTPADLEELVWLGNVCAGAIERVVTEETLAQREMESRLLLNASPFMAVLLDQNGIIVDINDQMCIDFGRSRAEVVGTCIFDFLPAGVAEDCRRLVDRVFITQEEAHVERSREGRIYQIECHPLHKVNGEVPRVALFIQDTTELKRNERLAALGMTASSLAHYIKNVQMSLNSSINYLDEQLMQIGNERVLKMWPVAKRAARRVDQLVMDILNLSRDRDPDLRPTKLNVFLNGLVEEYHPNAAAHNIDIIFEPGPGDLIVPIDHTQMWDVMLNLVANAIEAIAESKRPHGKIVIWAGRDEEAKDHAMIVVADNGPGLKPGIKDRIFDTFFTTKGGQGTGLGLAVAKKIIDGHKGSIHVDSIQDVGTTIKIMLPIALINEMDPILI